MRLEELLEVLDYNNGYLVLMDVDGNEEDILINMRKGKDSIPEEYNDWYVDSIAPTPSQVIVMIEDYRFR